MAMVNAQWLLECELAAHNFLYAEWERNKDFGFRYFTREQMEAQIKALGQIIYEAAEAAVPSVVDAEGRRSSAAVYARPRPERRQREAEQDDDPPSHV